MSDMPNFDLPKTEHYEALEFLGEGLNSCVYRGFRKTHHNLPKQEIAIKIFKKSKEVQEFEQRFQKLVRVRSRYCVGLLGWEVIGDQVAIIMDCVNGVSLARLVACAELSSLQKLEILAQLECAIKELHSFGIAHGDLSAANIMIDSEGQLRLIDYGFGQMSSGSEIVGSPRYLSPQRWQGAPVCEADDYFSMALISKDLFEDTINNKDTLKFLKRRSNELVPGSLGLVLENSQIKRELGDKVVSVLNRRLKSESTGALQTLIMKTCTAIFVRPNAFESNGLANAFASVCLSLTLLFPTFSGGSLSTEKARREVVVGYIEFRTKKWFEIELGSQKLGYTPIKKIAVPSGRHILKWRAEGRSGFFKIKVPANGHVVIRDSDLLSK